MEILILGQARDVMLPDDKRLRLMGPPNTWISSSEYDRRLAEFTHYDDDETYQEDGINRAAIHKITIADMKEWQASVGKVVERSTQRTPAALGVVKPNASFSKGSDVYTPPLLC
jgi:hypothetical protein